MTEARLSPIGAVSRIASAAPAERLFLKGGEAVVVDMGWVFAVEGARFWRAHARSTPLTGYSQQSGIVVTNLSVKFAAALSSFRAQSRRRKIRQPRQLLTQADIGTVNFHRTRRAI
jgi:hypothetical protein